MQSTTQSLLSSFFYFVYFSCSIQEHSQSTSINDSQRRWYFFRLISRMCIIRIQIFSDYCIQFVFYEFLSVNCCVPNMNCYCLWIAPKPQLSAATPLLSSWYSLFFSFHALCPYSERVCVLVKTLAFVSNHVYCLLSFASKQNTIANYKLLLYCVHVQIWNQCLKWREKKSHEIE